MSHQSVHLGRETNRFKCPAQLFEPVQPFGQYNSGRGGLFIGTPQPAQRLTDDLDSIYVMAYNIRPS